MNSVFDISLILAVIGCITGCSSLAINFYKFVNERSRLRISFENTRCLYFKKLPYYESSRTNYHALVYMRILNKSSFPDVVYSIKGTLAGTPVVFTACDLQEISLKHSIRNSFDYSTRTFKLTPAFSLPLKFAPFDVWQGYLFVQFFPDPSADELSMDITISTSRKKAYKTKCVISKWDN